MAVEPTQTEVRVAIDANFLKNLQARLGLKKSSDVTRVALSLLDWASDEASHDRTILSATKDGKDIHRLVMTELSNVRKVNPEP
jgi:hypothetical protein